MYCPTPHKHAHPNRRQAENALTKEWSRGRQKHMPIRTYLCVCKMWHTTSKPYRKRAA